MNIERVNAVLLKAISSLQESELESLHEWPKKKKGKGKKKNGLLKKMIGRSPSEGNPLDPGSGIKGMIGRMKPM